MSFNAQHIEIGMADPKQDLPTLSIQEPKQDLPNLSMGEVILLLNIIREAKFEGKNIENLYNLTLKLQNIYVSLDKLQQL